MTKKETFLNRTELSVLGTFLHMVLCQQIWFSNQHLLFYLAFHCINILEYKQFPGVAYLGCLQFFT